MTRPRFRRFLQVLTLLGVLGLTAGFAQRFEWRDVVQKVTIGADGGVVFDDTRTLWTDDDFGEAFICVGLQAGQRLTLLDGSGGLGPGPSTTAFSQPCAAGTEVVVKNAQRVSQRRVRFVYRIDGTVDAFSDVVQWYWNPIQRDHPAMIGYDLTVHAPGPMAAPFDAYVHRYSNTEKPQVNLSPDRSTLHVAFNRIPSGVGLEIRYLMDPTLFSLTGTEPALAQLLADESSVAKLNVPGESPLLQVPRSLTTGSSTVTIHGTAEDPDGVTSVGFAGGGRVDVCVGSETFHCDLTDLPVGTTSITVAATDGAGFRSSAVVSVRRLSLSELIRRNGAWGVVPLVLVLLLLAGIVTAFRRYGKEPELPSMKYPFEPPSDLPPAAVTALGMQRFSSSSMGPAFHATIMDLARRGFGTFSPKGKRFEMQLHPEKDTSGLLPFEMDVLNYLKAAAKTHRRQDPNYLEYAELKAYSQARGAQFLPPWGKKVRAWVEAQRGGPLTDGQSRRVAMRWSGRALLAALAMAAAAFLTLGLARGLFIAGAGAAMVLTFVASIALPSWRKDVAGEVYGWQGFKRTLTDYTRMKDAPLDFFQLWDVYYCYAAALGVAAAFLKALRKAAPLAGVDDATLMARGLWMGGGNAGSLASFEAMASSIASMSSALSAASASASSGGSSSGGGGGGGGGGSSGGR